MIVRALSTVSRTLTLSNEDSLLLYFEGQVPDELESRDVEIRLYHNLNLEHGLLNYTKFRNGTISGYFAINNFAPSDYGRYEVQLHWLYQGPCYHYFAQFLRLTPYDQFYHSSFEHIILAKSHLNVIYTGKLYYQDTPPF